MFLLHPGKKQKASIIAIVSAIIFFILFDDFRYGVRAAPGRVAFICVQMRFFFMRAS